jgi:hypothetical protein
VTGDWNGCGDISSDSEAFDLLQRGVNLQHGFETLSASLIEPDQWKAKCLEPLRFSATPCHPNPPQQTGA